jgi:hypothetical protein
MLKSHLRPKLSFMWNRVAGDKYAMKINKLCGSSKTPISHKQEHILALHPRSHNHHYNHKNPTFHYHLRESHALSLFKERNISLL